MRDEVYRHSQPHIVDFAFTEAVAAVFPDMIRRSVPGYETMIPVTGLIAARHLGEHQHAYDLGCSLGATTLAILQHNNTPTIRVTGLDNSAAMIAGARDRITDPRADFVEQDILNSDVTGATVVVLNLVMQFIAPKARLPLLRQLREQMSQEGLLIVSEKVAHTDPWLHDLYEQTHIQWKKANGYSDLEVSQKRTALENVMQIDTEQTHHARFEQAGFTRAIQWYRCMNWASFLVYP
ncbi:MAG: carboxy-S-adenosyl-L-methionine synthase CmoA [Gammaproteobacteria bacterium]|jgi:tRNA (cmo5U34)-methyltransferase|nr:carboxy-S-adenosyl-L-methionine synthase CmoA [Gammaproteobacteria bacterium]MCH1549800.1 carboxy-S-adenosyl-L-methionine synthase CmoA [Pseudomonadales bacterium]